MRSVSKPQNEKDNLPVQINEIIKQKYQLLHKVKGKPKLAKKYPNVERNQIDMADQQERINKNKLTGPAELTRSYKTIKDFS